MYNDDDGGESSPVCLQRNPRIVFRKNEVVINPAIAQM